MSMESSRLCSHAATSGLSAMVQVCARDQFDIGEHLSVETHGSTASTFNAHEFVIKGAVCRSVSHKPPDGIIRSRVPSANCRSSTAAQAARHFLCSLPMMRHLYLDHILLPPVCCRRP